MARARAAGMDDYLTKPLLLDHLRGALEKWLPAAPAGASAVDAHREAELVNLDELRRLVGDDPAVIREVLLEFEANTAELGREIEQAVVEKDSRAVARAAHQLKSSASAIGAFAFADVCVELESAAMSEDPTTLDRRHESFQAAIPRVLQTVRFTLANRGPR